MESLPDKRTGLVHATATPSSYAECSVTTIQQIELPTPGIAQLQAEAHDEGYSFIETLVAEWSTGSNRFDQPGEVLLGCIDHGLLVAVGGLNRDPFVADSATGRIRRVYIRADWRTRGIGRTLVTSLLDCARSHFCRVRLRAENPTAARLYERLGFVPIDDPQATHLLTFETAPQHQFMVASL